MTKLTDTLCRATLLLLALMVSALAGSQNTYYTYQGTVSDAETGRRLPYVAIAVVGQHVSIVSNADGEFVLKTPVRPSQLVLTHVGYQTTRCKVGAEGQRLNIRMQPGTIQLSEVVVASGDAEKILRSAIGKIPANYSSVPELFRGFYRETTERGRRYIYVAEAVVNMYKTEYTRDVYADRVSIDKARRLISTRKTDTLGAKMVGGPTLPVYIDVAKNIDYLFSEETLRLYDFSLAPPEKTGDRPQVVVLMRPRKMLNGALYIAKVYIDRETLSFSRVEMDLDMTDKTRATAVMLVSKPAGVRFKPRQLSLVVNYSLADGVSRISYVRSTSRFNCDWKRRLFHSGYTVTSEMVVTDRAAPDRVHRIRGKSSFRPHESLYDKVELFDDPQFWGHDNIIEPTESLEHAINKLKKKLRE